MQTTKLTSESILPLTCSRAGTCCYGKAVMLNPWELLQFSIEKKVSAKTFRDLYTDFGGVRLTFNGTKDAKGQSACSQYIDTKGCSVHNGRPLACRLYPLGRQIQFNKAHYMFEGKAFPCLTDCAEVLNLPKLTVGNYLKGQGATPFENAQDAYLEIMQNIADVAFQLLLETGLSASGDTKTLQLWQEMGNALPEDLTQRIATDWLDALMLPTIDSAINNPIDFATAHNELLMAKIQDNFGGLDTLDKISDAAVVLIGVALQLARGLGANTKEIASHWVATAKSHGALD